MNMHILKLQWAHLKLIYCSTFNLCRIFTERPKVSTYQPFSIIEIIKYFNDMDLIFPFSVLRELKVWSQSASVVRKFSDSYLAPSGAQELFVTSMSVCSCDFVIWTFLAPPGAQEMELCPSVCPWLRLNEEYKSRDLLGSIDGTGRYLSPRNE